MDDRECEFEQEPGLRQRLGFRAGVLLGLLYLVAQASDLAHSSLSSSRIAVLAAGLGVFVAIYWSLMPPIRWLRRRGDGWRLGALALLPVIAGALLLGRAPSSFTALFIYVVAASGVHLGFRPALAVLTVTAVGVSIGTWAAGSSGATVATWALTVVSIGTITIAFGWFTRVNRELRAARDDLARLAVSEERLRIARDLHDLLGHSLSLIALKTELAARVVRRDADRAEAELAEVAAVTRRALAEVRSAVQGYRNLALDEALDGARVALSAAGIDYHLQDSRRAVPPEVEAVLAWAVREGTTNVVRHSHADRCDIRIQATDGLAELEVEDDGHAGPAARTGSGLNGLAERARAVRGTLEAGPRRDGGFRLRLTIPLVEP